MKIIAINFQEYFVMKACKLFNIWDMIPCSNVIVMQSPLYADFQWWHFGPLSIEWIIFNHRMDI